MEQALDRMLRALKVAQRREEHFEERRQAQQAAEEALRAECRQERLAAGELWAQVQQQLGFGLYELLFGEVARADPGHGSGLRPLFGCCRASRKSGRRCLRPEARREVCLES